MSGPRVSDRPAEGHEKTWKKFGAAINYPYF